MKRILYWGMAAVLPWGRVEVQAQTASDGRARIVAVTESRQGGRFQVPQVQLANVAAARRINRRIVRLMLGEQADSMLSVSRQLQQAERVCCYDDEAGQGWQTVGHGLTGCAYKVLLNEHGLLSLEYFKEFTGAYSWESTSHATFDLRTGRALTLADLVADSPAQLTRRMHGAISRRLAESLGTINPAESDPAEIGFVAEQFHWDWAASRVRFQSDPGPAEEARADEPDLENFALMPYELRLYYGPMLPHIRESFEPDGTYHFPYARLQPRDILKPLVKPTPARKR